MNYCQSAIKEDVNNGKLYKDKACTDPVNQNGVFQHHDFRTYLVSFDHTKAPMEDYATIFYCFKSTINENTVSSQVKFKHDDVLKAEQLALDEAKARKVQDDCELSIDKA